MIKIIEIIKNIICVVFFGITAIFIFDKHKNKKIEKDSEKLKEDKINEIEKTDAADLVANSHVKDRIQSGINDEQEEFRKRVRDRLNKKL